MKFTRKIDGIGRIQLSGEICKALGIKASSSVYICGEGRKIVLRSTPTLQTLISRNLDEWDRLVLPFQVRKCLKVKAGDEVVLQVADDAVILTK